MRIRTSQTHPLRIDAVDYPDGPGRIGLTLCPGKEQPDAKTGAWARDLEADMEVIHRWGARAVVTLIEPQELEQLQVEGLPRAVKTRGMGWCHLPIPDRHAPDERFISAWPESGLGLHLHLLRGENVLLHCMGGLGRTGTVAAQLLIETGMTPAEAIRRVRAVRPNAIETRAQEHYLQDLPERDFRIPREPEKRRAVATHLERSTAEAGAFEVLYSPEPR